MRATIEDVARRAGTSPTTVSRVLNRSGYVGEDTQRRIERAIAELDYEPRRIARQMRGKPTRLVGLIIPYIDSVNYGAYTQAVAEALNAKQYDLMLCINNEDSDTDLRHLINLRNQRVDGILYCHPAQGSNSALLWEMSREGIAVVEVMRHRETNRLHAVLSDEERAGYRLTEHLLSRGHRRIGFLAPWPTISSVSNHLAGYERALRGAGLAKDADLVRTGQNTSAEAEECAIALLDMPNPPSALFCVTERVVLGVLAAISRRQLRIPEDISLVSNAAADWLRVWNPPITFAGAPLAALAHAAVDVLLRCIESPESVGEPVVHFLEATLIEGGSVKTIC